MNIGLTSLRVRSCSFSKPVQVHGVLREIPAQAMKDQREAVRPAFVCKLPAAEQVHRQCVQKESVLQNVLTGFVKIFSPTDFVHRITSPLFYYHSIVKSTLSFDSKYNDYEVIFVHFPRLLELRQDVDKGQKEIAAILGIDQRTYSNYETGKREIPIHHLITLADYYRVSIDYIVGRTKRP